ncbi:hypothetical protein H6P81_009526 [Aristolochia fimbriata]|uniref:Uncharacterized protein n=1 Tax=Aristolochia fimbriata TaxID=158543 RepID=A0AAV7ENU0_ARIFI|nr:hypothetical protein H6P81_009526 [Aristolochia fimbriata]
MVTQASKLKLPLLHPSSEVSSLLFEPFSRSLALMLSDASILLYPFMSPLSSSSSSSSSPSSHPTVIAPNSTSFAFVRLAVSPNSTPRYLFLAAGPHRSSVLLRAWILSQNQTYTRARISYRKDVKSSVDLDLRHGFSVTLAGSVNVLILLSAIEQKVCVFGVKMAGDDTVELMRCASIECTVPIYTLRVSMGFLLFGEENGVRVFPVRPLLKGRLRTKTGKADVRVDGGLKGELPKALQAKRLNGFIVSIDDKNVDATNYKKYAMNCWNGESVRLVNAAEIPSCDYKGPIEVDLDSAKRRSVKLKQDSGELGSFFVPFKCTEVQSANCKHAILASLKAVSIHSLSQKSFLILDSNGDMHILSLLNCDHNPAYGPSSISSKDSCLRHMNYSMKVQMLAVFPDTSARSQTVWISDGSYSVHVTSVGDLDFSVGENNEDESEEKLMRISASHALFTSEKVRDVVPFASNGVLVLGQGSIFTYAIS